MGKSNYFIAFLMRFIIAALLVLTSPLKHQLLQNGYAVLRTVWLSQHGVPNVPEKTTSCCHRQALPKKTSCSKENLTSCCSPSCPPVVTSKPEEDYKLQLP